MFLSLIDPAAARKLFAAVIVVLSLCLSAAIAGTQAADRSDSSTETNAGVVDKTAKTGGKHARTDGKGDHHGKTGKKHAGTEGKCESKCDHGSKGGKKHACTEGKGEGNHRGKGGKHARIDGKGSHDSGHHGSAKWGKLPRKENVPAE